MRAAPAMPVPSRGVSPSMSMMALGSGVVWSFGALTARLASHADAWQYLIWRSVAIIVVVEVIGVGRRRAGMLRRAYTSGWRVIAGCVALLVASVGFVYAVKNTTAANAAFLASLTPLMAVVMARVILGERLSRVTVGAITVALAGLVVMVTADVGAGSPRGNIAAVLAAVGFAGYTVCVRSAPHRDWAVVMPGYASMMIVLCVVVCLVNGTTLVPPAADIGYALVHGGVFIVVGTLLFNVASRHIPAVPMTVLTQTETVFVPLWIFLRFGETPTATTLLGGAMILSAVVGKTLLDARPVSPSLADAGPGTIA